MDVPLMVLQPGAHRTACLSMHTLPHSQGILYTPGVLSPKLSLTSQRGLDTFLGGRPTDSLPLFLHSWAFDWWLSATHLLTLFPRSRVFLPRKLRPYVPTNRRFTQDLRGATSQKTAFFSHRCENLKSCNQCLGFKETKN
jgi:hypothetical protein